MRTVSLTVAAILPVLLAGQLFGQSLKQPAPDGTGATPKEFLTAGGVVNFSAGEVTRAAGAQAAERLMPRDELHSGDMLRLGRDGRAEILLNPGYYLRLSADTEVALIDLSPDNLKLKLLKGAAIIEISVNYTGLIFGQSGEINKLFYDPVTIITARDEYAVTEGGVYRLDVRAGGDSELRVLKGMAVVKGHKVQSGARARVQSGQVTLTKLGEASEDAFDLWSRERAGLLLKINKTLKDAAWYRQMSREGSSDFITGRERAAVTREQLTISALSGIVNFADDGVSFKRGEASWEKLKAGERLQHGDRLSTGALGRAAVLLYPDCALHLGGAAEIIYSDEASTGLTVSLLKGSAIVVNGTGGKDGAPVALAAPGIRYGLTRPGVYRLNVLPQSRSEMLVYLGRAASSGGNIKEGQKAIYDDTGLTVLRLDRKAVDSFDVWSYRTTLSSAAGGGNYFLGLYKNNRVRFGGLWVFDKGSGQHTFVPGLWSFRSPYGGQYSTRIKTSEISPY
jgi:hypothetical protein